MKRALLATAIITLALILAGCSNNPTSTLEEPQALDLVLDMNSGIETGKYNSQVLDLSEQEAADLIFMREEEKLARDVYLTFFDSYGEVIFSSIAASEQNHMDKMLVLINRYGLEDPVGDNGLGVFDNPELQALYEDLIAQGSADLEAALRVGGAIEEIDILDLDEAIAAATHADIIRVYGNLQKGSENHLRGFVRELGLMDIIYVPLYLSQEAYDAIIEGSSGHGGHGHGR